ncbi:MAG: DUF2231 domain-containing protein [Desulfomonilaceae bacterium]
MKTFSLEEISRCDGKDGRPSLVVVDGKVYDVSSSKRWVGGQHMRRHQAGGDLGADIKAAPHGREVLERVELLGHLVMTFNEKSPGLKGSIETFLERHPFYRRHPHPAMVHFPLGLLLITPVFEIAAILTGSVYTEWAAYLTLAFGSLSILGAIVTGYMTWWLNYDAKESKVIKTKRISAWTAFLLAVLACFLRSFVIVDPLRLSDTVVTMYLINVLSVAALIGYTGFLGGKLTFPYE